MKIANLTGPPGDYKNEQGYISQYGQESKPDHQALVPIHIFF